MKIYEMIFVLKTNNQVRVLAVADKLGDAVNIAIDSIKLKHSIASEPKLKVYEEYNLDTNHAWVFDIQE